MKCQRLQSGWSKRCYLWTTRYDNGVLAINDDDKKLGNLSWETFEQRVHIGQRLSVCHWFSQWRILFDTKGHS